jgi:hypothetical protein
MFAPFRSFFESTPSVNPLSSRDFSANDKMVTGGGEIRVAS